MDSSLSSRTPSRGTTPVPIEPQPNPYRLPRFWKGVIAGAAGLYGITKLGSFASRFLQDKFHRQNPQSYAIAPYAQREREPLPAIAPPPQKQKKSLRVQVNRHN